MAIIIKNNGRVTTIKGGSIQIVNGQVLADGKNVEEINTDEKNINITIEGSVERLEIDYCNEITINGAAKRVHTYCGNITVKGDVSGDVHSNCGSITCGNVEGDCRANLGSILRRGR